MTSHKPILRKATFSQILSDTTESRLSVPVVPLPITEQATEPMPTLIQPLSQDDPLTQPVSSFSVTLKRLTLPAKQTDPHILTNRADPSTFTDVYDEDICTFHTVSLHTIEQISAQKQIKATIMSIVLTLLSILVPSTLIWLIVVAPDPLYKAEIGIVLLVTCSYLFSTQIRFFSQARKKSVLSTIQIMQATNKTSASFLHTDREHFTVSKQDTTAYLRALSKKDLKKGSRP